MWLILMRTAGEQPKYQETRAGVSRLLRVETEHLKWPHIGKCGYSDRLILKRNRRVEADLAVPFLMLSGSTGEFLKSLYGVKWTSLRNF
jgi:hypothetical protein